MSGPNVVWRPQEGPQKALLTCPISEIFYGGARFGGKTDGFLGHFAKHEAEEGKNARGILCRPTQPELDDVIDRAKQLFYPLGYKWTGRPEFRLTAPSGGFLKFKGLETEDDMRKVQGHSYSWIALEELPTWANIQPLLQLYATLRGPARKKWFLANGNPGGVSHAAVKARYIDLGPYTPFTDPETGTKRVYIPATYRDNRIGMEQNPDYVGHLKASGEGSEALVRAWLDGDWDAPVGQYFTEWDPERHVIRPFEVPKYLTCFRSMDYGTSVPFSIGWWVVWDGSKTNDGRWFPRGTLIRIAEWYGAAGPNKGLKLTAAEIAEGINERQKALGMNVIGGPADTDLWGHRGGEMPAETMARKGVDWVQANKRDRVNGWRQVRLRLKSQPPLMVFFDCCKTAIEFLPAAVHDLRHPEDINTKGEDHCVDEIRYACLFRPLILDKKDEVKKTDGLTIADLMQEANLAAKNRRKAARFMNPDY